MGRKDDENVAVVVFFVFLIAGLTTLYFISKAAFSVVLFVFILYLIIVGIKR